MSESESEEIAIRALERADREWVAHFLDEHWGTTQIVSRGRILYGHLLPGYVAERPEANEQEEKENDEDNEASDSEEGEQDEDPASAPMERIGLLTYNLENNECEVTTLDSLTENQGVGTALVDALKADMKEAGCERIWLITTNDNLEALKFWQKRDFELVSVHRGAIAQARRLKPQIPIIGKHGIPIRDEIELEFRLK